MQRKGPAVSGVQQNPAGPRTASRGNPSGPGMAFEFGPDAGPYRDQGDQSTREQGYTIFYVDAQSEEQLQAAVDAIREKISPLEPKDGEIQRFFEIPDSKVSEVLGPQGVALARIKERSGARLEIRAIPPAEYHGSTRGMPRTVNCVGTEEAVNKCEELVNKVVAGTVTCADLISEYEVGHPEVRSQKRLSSTPSYDETKRRRMDYDDYQRGGFDNSYNAGYQRGGGFGGSRVGGPMKGGGKGAWNDNSAAADFCILEVPSNGVGAIIGRGGEIINRLKEDSSCDIQISKSGAGPYREVSLQGPHDGIITVVGFINERLAGAHVVKAAPANGLPPYLFGSGDGAPRGRMGSGGPQPYMQQQGPPSTARSYGMQGGPPEAYSTPPGQPWQQPQMEGYSAGNSMMPQYQQQPPPYAGGLCTRIPCDW
ncbi:hypothetical protein Pmar_PMAR020037 [Perkinsus marinus ATCC 50983]|uniref:K Homology domain-containing protein n=1 Tax=Perkinsus marinus (strain ATCC 50983 / TXsc) TaxID=423536 RepID=C5L0J5_PERM5|nr:hypothetical protein Pmar_PMAR020037 [Perkinsus marinus ATCC 50983]EER09743.1 hypothetical protein Pmar_PMAR020037 [Perkinsus marinus ATCC 50983]|eukprot:XP_002777948.1 hypothetical protein Pmar_PMAR020037 [Perkinsus marinus ATCC 50983]